MKKKLLLSMTGLLAAVTLLAQQPEEVVSKALAKLKSPHTAAFTLAQKADRVSQEVTLNGDITLQGAKFYVNTKEMSAWYDGKTQWVYLASSDEVTVTEPDADEAADMNPVLLVGQYLDKCTVIFSTTEKSQTDYIVEFYPKDKMSDMLSLVLRIRKSDLAPVSVRIKTSQGGYTRLRLTNVHSVQAPAATFRFNPQKCPTAYINDLR